MCIKQKQKMRKKLSESCRATDVTVHTLSKGTQG